MNLLFLKHVGLTMKNISQNPNIEKDQCVFEVSFFPLRSEEQPVFHTLQT